jgi:rubrerythrin
MAITFNADEIFEMAEQIERNAAKFYRQAAKNTPDKKTKQMLLDMAVMEDGHLTTFGQMRKQLSSEQRQPMVFDPENQAVLYLQAMADAHGSEGRISPTKALTGKETIVDVLKIAINSEKDSVVFYSGLKAVVPVRAGRDKVEAIIAEELSHIAILQAQLKELAAAG